MVRPHLSLNFALSADGRITSIAGISSGWTSEADQERFHRLRVEADALLVGRGTLEADRMTLTAPQNPLRCVISRTGKFDPSHPLFHTPGGPIHLLGTEHAPRKIKDTVGHHSTLAQFLERLHQDFGVERLHCEGGASLVRELAEIDAIDEIHLTWAGHTLFGGRDAPGLTGPPGDFLASSRHYQLTHFESLTESGECFLSYRRA
ncbi:riboflavin-specific deaminase-like protein [Haloferula luteola]|uniref:Riboflavin-specific deaminase-like protein n=1 Tax=Haloferula luteola TaxID=595692 RepID=A0A840VDZ7_9BACT|nr:RibD family protein [Haloferula luteola]MBB5352858.1 riboflavin-specific deaminase-like protein [Haloferula luteola]